MYVMHLTFLLTPPYESVDKTLAALQLSGRQDPTNFKSGLPRENWATVKID